MKKPTINGLSAAAMLAVGMTLFACSEKQPTAAETVPVTAAPVDASAAPVTATVPAPPVTAPAAPPVTEAIAASGANYSPEAMEALLAPVALYPDAVLAQVLASSLNPQEVLDAGNWLVANPNTKSKELDAAATAAGFTPPMMALMQFPTVVDMMCMKMDWTTELGTAFQADEPGVLEAVQRLRKQAAEMGNLQSSEQMKVTTEEQNNQQIITVQPANPEVVYVPQYDPAVVYTTPPPPPAATTAVATTTAVTTSTGYSTGALVTTGLLSFGAGMLVNEVFNDDDDDHDYYSPPWGYGGGSSYYPPPYYPRYGNGFRPANGYNRPPNYQHGFNNNNIYVNANGKDYFNRFDGGKNNFRNRPNSPISAARPNRPELGQLNERAQNGKRPAALGQGANRKVQGGNAGDRPNMPQRPAATAQVPKGTYAGAKPGARPNTTQRPVATGKVPKGAYAGSSPAARQKINAQSAGTRDRGHTASKKVARPAARPQHNAGHVAKAPNVSQKASRPAARKAPAQRSSAFQGSRNHGNAERAASNRGRASMHQGGKKSGGGHSGGQKRGNRR